MKVKIVISSEYPNDIQTYLDNQKFITESSQIIETRRGRFAATATVEVNENDLIVKPENETR